MISFRLFLGFYVDPTYNKLINKLDPKVREMFFRGQGDYLSELEQGERCYLGKYTGSSVTLSDLELLEKNVLSLLKKIVPNYPYDQKELVLLPVPENPPK